MLKSDAESGVKRSYKKGNARKRWIKILGNFVSSWIFSNFAQLFACKSEDFCERAVDFFLKVGEFFEKNQSLESREGEVIVNTLWKKV